MSFEDALRGQIAALQEELLAAWEELGGLGRELGVGSAPRCTETTPSSYLREVIRPHVRDLLRAARARAGAGESSRAASGGRPLLVAQARMGCPVCGAQLLEVLDGHAPVGWRCPECRAAFTRVEPERYPDYAAIKTALADALEQREEVKLAVLMGSMARGDAEPDSDVDVLVILHESPRSRIELEIALRDALGRRVDVIRLSEGRPQMIHEALVDGVVIKDVDGVWPSFQARLAEFERAAKEYDADLTRRTREALDEMIRRADADA